MMLLCPVHRTMHLDVFWDPGGSRSANTASSNTFKYKYTRGQVLKISIHSITLKPMHMVRPVLLYVHYNSHLVSQSELQPTEKGFSGSDRLSQAPTALQMKLLATILTPGFFPLEQMLS